MLNILFSLFLFGMLIVLCAKALFRALNHEQPLTYKELALLIALSLGCLMAMSAGSMQVYKVPVFF